MHTGIVFMNPCLVTLMACLWGISIGIHSSGVCRTCYPPHHLERLDPCSVNPKKTSEDPSIDQTHAGSQIHGACDLTSRPPSTESP